MRADDRETDQPIPADLVEKGLYVAIEHPVDVSPADPVVAILTPIYESKFLGFSYGFRPKRTFTSIMSVISGPTSGGSDAPPAT